MERKKTQNIEYKLTDSLADFIAMPRTRYGEISLSPLEQKRLIENTAEVFQVKGFETLIDETIEGQTIPLLLKRKMSFGKPFEVWACFFYFGKEPAGIGEVETALGVLYSVKKEIVNRFPANSYFSGSIISKSPFKPEAVALAEANGIEIETFEQLFANLLSH